MGFKKTLLHLPFDEKGIFLTRINRFLAEIRIGKNITFAHIHDPGRLKELLYPENTVLLKQIQSPHRKTKWDIIAARKNSELVFVHSGYHSLLAERILASPISPFKGLISKRKEVKYGSHRYDFLLTLKNNEKVWLEIKGCTLERDGISMFPDAPTKRGKNHIKGLIELKKQGYRTCVLFLIFTRSICFLPNHQTDPEFFDVFFEALESGVEMFFYELNYNGKNIAFERKVNLCPDQWLNFNHEL